MIKNLLKNSWRFYFFKNDNNFYCFDCFTQKIVLLSENLYFLLESGKFFIIKYRYRKFFQTIINKKENFSQQISDTQKAFVTVNLSNKCNLNCSYCYRNKLDKTELSKEDIKKIFDYVSKIYMPNAKEYSYSFSNTSESSFDLDLLKYVDELITEYEGNLFNATTSDKVFEELFKRLPPELQEKYSDNETFINRFNRLLKKEELWLILPYENVYLKSVIDKKNKLSLSKKVMANRLILALNNIDLNIFATSKYYSMWFMTNGTNVTDDYITFLKSIFKNEITVSIDGPKIIHNSSRVFLDGRGSFDKTLEGIRKFQENNFSVIASVTLTPQYPDYYEIVKFLSTIGIKSINCNLARGNQKSACFNDDSIKQVIISYKKLFNKIYDELQNEKYEFLPLLKRDFMFTPVKCIYYRKYKTSRCNFGNELVVSSSGDLYHCNSTIGLDKDFLGNIDSKISYEQIANVNNDVRKNKRCKQCFAKYLCGGTCYANDYLDNQMNKKTECTFRKEIIKLSIMFYAKVQQNGFLDRLMLNLE